MSGDNEKVEKRHALMGLCRELFTRNAIGSDFDRVRVSRVSGRNFVQQPDGEGVHVEFSVSNHMLGKLGGTAHAALETLLGSES